MSLKQNVPQIWNHKKAFIVERELFYFRLFLVKIDAENDENLSLVL